MKGIHFDMFLAVIVLIVAFMLILLCLYFAGAFNLDMTKFSPV